MTITTFKLQFLHHTYLFFYECLYSHLLWPSTGAIYRASWLPIAYHSKSYLPDWSSVSTDNLSCRHACTYIYSLVCMPALHAYLKFITCLVIYLLWLCVYLYSFITHDHINFYKHCALRLAVYIQYVHIFL